jgi:nitroreductase
MIELLRSRRSIRKFTDQALDPGKVELLKEALLRSPTSKNSKATEFIFVDDISTLEKLARCKPTGASALQTATLAVVVLANESQTVACIEDCAIASILLQITAHSLGLGSCWIQIRGRDYSDEKSSESYVSEILNIPPEYIVLSLIALGYPLRIPEGKPFEELDFGKIHKNGF